MNKIYLCNTCGTITEIVKPDDMIPGAFNAQHDRTGPCSKKKCEAKATLVATDFGEEVM